MKYEYQDVIVKTLINQLKDDLDKSTLKDARLDIVSSSFGYYKSTFPKDNTEDTMFYMKVEKGVIFHICDSRGSEYSIDFTVYEIMNPYGDSNHIFCNLDIK